jgi:hypothetical protein
VDLKFLAESGYVILLQILVKVMLLNMKLNVLVEGKTGLIPIIHEGLNLGHDRTPGGDNPLATQKLSVERPEHWRPFLVFS